MFRLFKKKEKIKRELPPGTIRKEFHFEGNVQNIDRIQIDSMTEKDIPLNYYENDFYILY